VPTVVGGFTDAEEKENHFLDHWREFNPRFVSADAYEAAAVQFLTKTRTTTILECVRRNGDIIRFDQTSDEFAICSHDGILKTYYKPTPLWHQRNSNLLYFWEQCAR
jgi:pyocin large subunit-like protein